MIINNLEKLKSREYLNFGLFSLGKFVSLFGSAIYKFAIGLYVLKLTGSGLSFAMTLILGYIPMIILNPFAGVLADKFNKKRIVVIMDLLNGALFLTLYMISISNTLTLSMIYLSTFVTTVFTTLFDISFESAVPNIVKEKLLMKLNSVSKIISSLSSIVAPMLGGIIYAIIDIKLFILINGISFVFSGISEMFIDFKLNIKNTEDNNVKEKINFIKDIKEGLNYLLSRTELVELFIILIFLNFANAFAILVPVPYIINNYLKLSSQYYGIITSAVPVGMIVGAVFVHDIQKKVPIKKLIIIMSFAVACIMIAIGLPIFTGNTYPHLFYLFYYSAVKFILGVVVSFIDVPMFYLFQTMLPDEYRGRVISIGLSFVKSIVPISMLLSGLLLNNINPYYIPIICGLLLLVGNTALSKVSYSRKLGKNESES